MTDKLKCPFCNADLIVHTDEQMAVCRNPNCKYDRWHFPLEIWQAIIDGKKAQDALNVAIDALSKIDTFNCPGKGLIETAAGMVSIANRALYEITSITKHGEKK